MGLGNLISTIRSLTLASFQPRTNLCDTQSDKSLSSKGFSYKKREGSFLGADEPGR